MTKPDEFSGPTAFVVGGSRGLGEVACKLLAAGGADLTLTYSRGEQDAQRVQEELAGSTGSVDTAKLDILAFNLPELEVNDEGLVLLFFATPTISASGTGFSSEKFQMFCDYYVAGLSNLVHQLTAAGHHVRGVLSPSSEFVDTLPRDMAEYAAAKAASETACRHLEKQIKGLRVHCPRWPKLETDQTATLVPQEYGDAAETILQSLRHLYQWTA